MGRGILQQAAVAASPAPGASSAWASQGKSQGAKAQPKTAKPAPTGNTASAKAAAAPAGPAAAAAAAGARQAGKAQGSTAQRTPLPDSASPPPAPSPGDSAGAAGGGLNPLAIALPVAIIVLLLVVSIAAWVFVMRRRRRRRQHSKQSQTYGPAAAQDSNPVTKLIDDGCSQLPSHKQRVPAAVPAQLPAIAVAAQPPAISWRGDLEPPSEFTVGYTPAEVRAACSHLSEELHGLLHTLEHHDPAAVQALLHAATARLPAEVHAAVWSEGKGAQQDAVRHHVWKVLQAVVWDQAFTQGSWLVHVFRSRGFACAPQFAAAGDFQALCAAWSAGQLSPMHSRQEEAAAAAVLAALMPASSCAIAGLRGLLAPFVQEAMRCQVVALACHPGLRFAVDGWDSCGYNGSPPSQALAVAQLLQGLRGVNEDLHLPVGAPVHVASSHAAAVTGQWVLLCVTPGVVWAPTQEAALCSVGAVQEVKVLECSRAHELTATTAGPGGYTATVRVGLL